MNWIIGEIHKIKKWNEKLFTLIVHASIDPFLAGQFTKLAILNKKNKISIQRAYSFVNPPGKKNLEFYILLIPNGKLTNYLYNLKPSEKILISKNSFGFFTLENIQSCKNLWMISTGTGIGPYISILQDHSWKKKFEKIIFVNAVRYESDLIYLPFLKKIKKKNKGKIKIITIVSRSKSSNKTYFRERIPKLIKNNLLEEKIGIKINSKNSHVMLCGNPNMVRETKKILQEEKKLKKNLIKKPGQITTENYW
ncbi:Flavodoxin/ferredoxin--NADP reductase [Buchnera aphidicola (Tetraneura ulmi)]|uniref:ferredoxin--NADP reductase n=1 Tax=Buchnera aphidicola TaxID=9 RepID=UPI003463F96F